MKRFFLPANCYAELSLLVSRFHGSNPILLSKYAYILHLLYTRTTLFKDDNEKGIFINAEEIYKIIGRENKARIFSNLIEWKFIVRVSKHRVGHRSQSFRLHERVLSDKFIIVSYDMEEYPWIRRIEEKNKKYDNQSRIEKHQLFILQNAIKLSDEGLYYIQQKYPSPIIEQIIEAYRNGKPYSCESGLMAVISFQQCDLMLMFLLAQEYFVSRPDPDSRIYSNMTSLKREYRQFVLLENKPIMMTDIRNSQILFSVPVIENRLKMIAGKKCVLPEDFYNYKLWAEDGTFYEKLAAEIGVNISGDEARKGFKQLFYQHIFFSKVSTRMNSFKKAFIRLFPNVYKAINLIKANDHADFAISLQRKEAQLIFSVIKKLNQKNIPALTIHDCIVVNSEDRLSITEELLKEECKKQYGIDVTFKREETHPDLPPFQPEEHENVVWLRQFGLQTNGNYCFINGISINVKSLKVRYGNSPRSYPYSRAGLAKLIEQQRALAEEKQTTSTYTAATGSFSTASVSGSLNDYYKCSTSSVSGSVDQYKTDSCYQSCADNVAHTTTSTFWQRALNSLNKLIQ